MIRVATREKHLTDIGVDVGTAEILEQEHQVKCLNDLLYLTQDQLRRTPRIGEQRLACLMQAVRNVCIKEQQTPERATRPYEEIYTY